MKKSEITLATLKADMDQGFKIMREESALNIKMLREGQNELRGNYVELKESHIELKEIMIQSFHFVYERFEKLENSVNARFDQVNNRFDNFALDTPRLAEHIRLVKRVDRVEKRIGF